MRGGSALPALTPRIPPHPRAASASASNTSTSRPAVAATEMATSASRLRGEVAGRRVGEVAGELRRHRRATRPRSAPRATASARRGRSDEHELGERRCRWPPSSAPSSGSGRAGRPRRRPARQPRRRRRRRRRATWPDGRACRRRPGEGCGGVTAPGQRQLGGVADADGDHARPALARHDECLADLALEPRRGERRAVQADLARDRALDADRHPDGAGVVGDAPRHRDRDGGPSIDGVGLNVARVGLGMPESLPGKVSVRPRRRGETVGRDHPGRARARGVRPPFVARGVRTAGRGCTARRRRPRAAGCCRPPRRRGRCQRPSVGAGTPRVPRRG